MHALSQMYTEYHIDGMTTYRAKAIIRERLGYCITIEEWLGNNVKGAGNDAIRLNQDDIQKYRHRWLDALAKEFSK